MGQDRVRRSCSLASRVRVSCLPLAAVIASLGLGSLPRSATAQEGPPARARQLEQPAYCRVSATKSASDGPRQLFAACRGRGITLGPVTEFEAHTNEASAATLVDARLGSERRILLLTIQADGNPLVEDLTGQIARRADRALAASIADLEIDTRDFAGAGVLAIRSSSSEGAPGVAKTIDLGSQISAVRAGRVAAAAGK